jgi:valyl-tRNA synthetase
VQHAFDLVTAVRNTRNERGMSPKEALGGAGEGLRADAARRIVIGEQARQRGRHLRCGESARRFRHLPGGHHRVRGGPGRQRGPAAEAKKAEEELSYLRGFLTSVEKKLGNERFVAGAPPQVLENERKKKADAEAKIKALEERLAVLK